MAPERTPANVGASPATTPISTPVVGNPVTTQPVSIAEPAVTTLPASVGSMGSDAQSVPTVMTVGDGVMFDAEPALQGKLGTVQPRAFFGSGLTRPEQFDWRVKWPEELELTGAKVVVVLLGVWDARDVTVTVDGVATTYVPGSDALAIFDAAGADVVWLLPMDEPNADKTAKLRFVADVIRTVVAKNTLMPDGSPIRVTLETQALVGTRGKKPDGEHLCADGAGVIADAVRDALSRRYSFSPRTFVDDSWRANGRYSVDEGCPAT
jgi:hypothetical protein